MATARVSQEVVEYATESPAKARVSQAIIEYVARIPVAVRVTQFIIEYIPIVTPPPPPVLIGCPATIPVGEPSDRVCVVTTISGTPTPES